MPKNAIHSIHEDGAWPWVRPISGTEGKSAILIFRFLPVYRTRRATTTNRHDGLGGWEEFTDQGHQGR